MASYPHSRKIARVVASLADEVRKIETARRPDGEAIVSSGSPALDRLLPEGGFRRGSLVEWIAGGAGSGAGTLALLAAGQAAQAGGAVVVVDHQRLFYPPAAIPLGIELARLFVVRPESPADHAWALDQVLRSRGVAAAWSWPLDAADHTLRRWQLAAETSGVLGLLVRPARARHEPSWAELRLAVEAVAEPRQAVGRSRRLRVELVRSRGGRAGQAVELEIPPREEQSPPAQYAAGPRSTNHETRAMHLAPPLAAAKTRRRSRGA